MEQPENDIDHCDFDVTPGQQYFPKQSVILSPLVWVAETAKLRAGDSPRVEGCPALAN
jgi:hypothetical protein